MGLGSALLRLGGVWIQSVGGVKRLIALYYGKIGVSTKSVSTKSVDVIPNTNASTSYLILI